jgi:hypothetical protein
VGVADAAGLRRDLLALLGVTDDDAPVPELKIARTV